MKESGIDMSYDEDDMKYSVSSSIDASSALLTKKKVTLRVNQRQLLDKQKYDNELRRTGRCGPLPGAGPPNTFMLGRQGGGEGWVGRGEGVEARFVNQQLRRNQVDAGRGRTLGTSLPRRLVRGADSSYIRSSPHPATRSLSLTSAQLVSSLATSLTSMPGSASGASYTYDMSEAPPRSELTVDMSGLDDGISSPRSVGNSSTTNSASEVDDLMANIHELEPIDAANTEDLCAIDPCLSQLTRQLPDFSQEADSAGDVSERLSSSARGYHGRGVWERVEPGSVSSQYSTIQVEDAACSAGGDQLRSTRRRWNSKDSNKSFLSGPSLSCPSPLSLVSDTATAYRGGRRKEEAPQGMSEEQRKVWERERIKKDNHNIIEKRRRYKINDCIQELARLLPTNYDLDLQNRKGTILEATVDYIQRLRKDQDKLVEMTNKQLTLEQKNRELQAQIQQLQSRRTTSVMPGSTSSQPTSYTTQQPQQQQAALTPLRDPSSVRQGGLQQGVHKSRGVPQGAVRLGAVHQIGVPQGSGVHQGSVLQGSVPQAGRRFSDYDIYQALHSVPSGSLIELNGEDQHMLESFLSESLPSAQPFHSLSSSSLFPFQGNTETSESLFHLQENPETCTTLDRGSLFQLQENPDQVTTAMNNFILTRGNTSLTSNAAQYREAQGHDSLTLAADDGFHSMQLLMDGSEPQQQQDSMTGREMEEGCVMDYDGMLLDDDGLARYGGRLIDEHDVDDAFITDLIARGATEEYLSGFDLTG